MGGNRNQRKGQSAIEYLTTYGWMLLVIAIVGGAIFTTVQDSAQIQSVSGLTNADVQVSDYGLNDDGLQLSLRASSPDQVNIQKVTITDTQTGVTADISPSEVVAVGDTTQVSLQDVQTTDTSDKYDLEITYDTGGLEGLVAEGQITGSFGVFNRISLENAKFNRSTNELQIDVKNTGDNTTNSISYTVEANNTDYTGSLSNLDAGETSQINVSTDETYPLKSINLDTEGTQFIDSNSGLKCTPTEGLVGYWTFNEEQTQNGYANDLSGYSNSGSISNLAVTGSDGKIDSSYNLTKGQVNTDTLNGVTLSEFTVIFWSKVSESSNNRLFIRKPWVGDGGFLGYISTPPRVVFGSQSDSGSRVEGPKTDLEYSKWTLHTYRFNGSSVSLWLNGKLEQSEAQQSKFTSSSGFKFGPGDAGLMDEPRIYNRSLTQQEIQRLYNVRSEDWAVSGCKLTG